MNKIKAIRGTHDILPGEVEVWQEIERVVRKKMRIHSYSEIRTPIFEGTGLFARSIGEDTDIVGKEMYTFRDKGDRSLTLRPEGTASVVRAFIENNLDQKGLPQRLWYMGPFFRQERPQKGRQRQFHQFGVEVIGSSSPRVDFDVIHLFDSIAEELELKDRMFSLNCLGVIESKDRYRKTLVKFLDNIEDKLCNDCRRRKVTNPLRVLDCKVPGCREVVHNSTELPKSIDNLNPEDDLNYRRLKDNLDAHKLNYKEDPFLVRGLDYYTGTVFAMKYEGLGAQSEIMGGGRYDNLVKELGGHDLPAVGFACGMERLILAMQAADTSLKDIKRIDVYVVNPLKSHDRAIKYVKNIRDNDFSSVMDEFDRSMKAQMRAASRLNAKYVLIIEPEDNIVSARNMETSKQEKMTFDEFLIHLDKDAELKKIT